MTKQTKIKLLLMVIAVSGWCSFLWLNGIGGSFDRPLMQFVVVTSYLIALPITYYIHKAFEY